MHIGIFAERFVGRYGADRVGVILAELLRQQGHRVTLVGVRFSDPVLQHFPGQTLRIPDFSLKGREAATLRYFKDTHYYRKRHLPDFDLCVVGSYPFITAIPYLQEISRGVLFIDYGVVPTMGYPPTVAQMIEEVRHNRKQTLRYASHIVPISDFLARDQSLPDSDHCVPVTTVLLAADHLVSRLGYTEGCLVHPRLPKDKTECQILHSEKSYTLRVIDQLQQEGRKMVLVLGRWEPGCYKNSQVACEVLRSLLDYEPDAALVVMADPTSFKVEDGLAGHIFCLGLPSDADLLEVVMRVDAGISVSLWEGFNLPVAELQYLGKPTLAFPIGAHPEVVIAQEQLCADAEEMARKLAHILDKGNTLWTNEQDLLNWREKFSWKRFITEFSGILDHSFHCGKLSTERKGNRAGIVSNGPPENPRAIADDSGSVDAIRNPQWKQPGERAA